MKIEDDLIKYIICNNTKLFIRIIYMTKQPIDFSYRDFLMIKLCFFYNNNKLIRFLKKHVNVSIIDKIKCDWVQLSDL